MKIHILPQSVADQIAAGEVVERPASVVKELIENAIDAEATQIDIFIENGGKKLIEVRDNGKGMAPEDAGKCVLRHATSKIQTIDDIFSIHSFGFRGEALAAISAISDFELVTKRAEDGNGSSIKVNAGKASPLESAPANNGTIIRVKDLFHPVPARLAHLKTDTTEMSAIRREVESFSLSNPQIGFTLSRDGKVILNFPVGDQSERVSQVLGEEASILLPVEGNFPNIKIHGWVLQPGRCGTNKKAQLLWVNGRHIEDHKLAWAVREAYHQTAGIEKHLFPKFALWIDIDPILVDVNVHPRKTEVKFSDPGDTWKAIKQTVAAGLQKHEQTALKRGGVARFSQPSFAKPLVQNKTAVKGFSQELFRTPKSFHALHAERSQAVPHSEEIQTEPTGKLTLVGQVANKYILAQGETGLWIFDQHALHERQRFEEFWTKRDTLLKEKQKLLIPHALKLDEEQSELLNQNTDTLNSLGFEFEDEKVTTVPSLFTEKDLDALFVELLEWIENSQVGEHAADALLRKMLEYKACRGAVMFGDSMQREEMQKLLDDFETTQWRNLCPHGRPNHVFWSFEELDREFHR